jgi:hypothetical protein
LYNHILEPSLYIDPFCTFKPPESVSDVQVKDEHDIVPVVRLIDDLLLLV